MRSPFLVAWKQTAHTATLDAITEFEDWLEDPKPDTKPDFKASSKTKVWTELKHHLFEEVFLQKCAYCETRGVGFYPDAEHYRPKASVVNVSDSGGRSKPRCALPDGRTIDHPGYFWLAFHWRNLVPSCKTCNTGAGKGTQFPTSKPNEFLVALSNAELAALHEVPIESTRFAGHYYLGPEDLDEREEALLLNPLNPKEKQHEPLAHLVFGVRGIVTARDNSRRGLHSIRTYNLKYELLRQARQEAQENAWRQYGMDLAMDTSLTGVDRAKLSSGDRPYSEAIRQFIDEGRRIQFSR
ncbi:MAG: hypothetical protein FJW32_15315 [Acidobacteria bacterium]|nr:hypothetical protein [Acidobacteriota bacterium]